MAKRFTDTEKWDDPWFRQLSPKMKCCWQFICDRCNLVGIWKIDIPTLSHFIGETITIDEINLCINKGKIRFNIISLEELLVLDFIPFQYGDISQSKHPFHKRIYTLYHRVLNKVSDRVQEGVQDKEKEEEEGGLGETPQLQDQQNKTDEKEKHLEFVFLKPSEVIRLKRELGNEFFNACIFKLNAYLTNNKKKRKQYQDHNLVIRDWVIDEVKKKIQPKPMIDKKDIGPSEPPPTDEDRAAVAAEARRITEMLTKKMAIPA
jgi:hypothetical protein